MAKKKKRTQQTSQTNKADQNPNVWISMRSGLKVITILSLAVAGLTIWQAIPIKGLLEAVLYGLGFGGSIWVIFIGALFFNRLLRGS